MPRTCQGNAKPMTRTYRGMQNIRQVFDRGMENLRQGHLRQGRDRGMQNLRDWGQTIIRSMHSTIVQPIEHMPWTDILVI